MPQGCYEPQRVPFTPSVSHTRKKYLFHLDTTPLTNIFRFLNRLTNQPNAPKADPTIYDLYIMGYISCPSD